MRISKNSDYFEIDAVYINNNKRENKKFNFKGILTSIFMYIYRYT